MGRVIVPGDVSMEEHPEVIIRSSDAKRFLNGLGTLDFSICRTAAAECMERGSRTERYCRNTGLFSVPFIG